MYNIIVKITIRIGQIGTHVNKCKVHLFLCTVYSFLLQKLLL
jgi:hypothetical protein